MEKELIKFKARVIRVVGSDFHVISHVSLVELIFAFRKGKRFFFLSEKMFVVDAHNLISYLVFTLLAQ